MATPRTERAVEDGSTVPIFYESRRIPRDVKDEGCSRRSRRRAVDLRLQHQTPQRLRRNLQLVGDSSNALCMKGPRSTASVIGVCDDRPMTQVTKTTLVPEELARSSAEFNYSPGVVIEGGRLVICSGQVGRDADGLPIRDPTQQYVAAFENVGCVLAEAGAGFEDVVELVTFHTSFDGFELFKAIKDRYLTGPFHPAWTGVGVSALALPGLLVEIKATAVVR